MFIIRLRIESLKHLYVKLLCFRFCRGLTSHGKRAVLVIYLLTIMLCSTLHAAEVKSTTVTLTWTATGDNGSDIAPYYALKYSLVPITKNNWDSAQKVLNVPAPKYRGSAESFVIMELTPETDYYFAIKVGDESDNWSELSNVVMFRTVSPPICGDLDESGRIDVADLVYLVVYMFIDGIPNFNLNVIDLDLSGIVDVSDLIFFVGYMFNNGSSFKCP